MLEYTLVNLPCWGCDATFAVFTDLSNHHLAQHERPLHGQPVAAWLTPLPLGDPCYCGHPLGDHTLDTIDMACKTEGCDCEQFLLERQLRVPASPHPTAPAPRSVLHVFWCQCQLAALPYDEIDVRLLLDTLGVPPDAPAERWEASIAEAVQRWKDRKGGAV